MERSRRNAWLLTLASACVLGASVVPMARRVEAFNRGAAFTNVHFEPITSRDVRVEGFRDARIDDAVTPEGRAAVRLEYAGTTTLIPVKAPPAKGLPGLAGYDEWLKVLALYDVGRERGVQVRLRGSERVWIVVRRTPEGVDPVGWGQSRRTEWVFDFYDLKRDGTVAHSVRRWPGSAHAEEALRAAAAGAGGRAPDPAVRALLEVPKLEERTPEYQAAMHVIPKLNVPRYRFNNDAFSPAVLGWTLPAGMISGLVFTGALVFALAPRRRAGGGTPAVGSGERTHAL